MIKKNIIQCSRCIMNNSSDNTIFFNSEGVCNYCLEAIKKINTTTYFPDKTGRSHLEEMLSKIKSDGKGKRFDCVMGISGGLDSSYLAYLGSQWGLRILALHIDDGFDTDISKSNISKLCKVSGITLETIKPDAEQFNALIKAYMQAGVPNIAIPQDSVLFAALYKFIRKEKVKYFLSGGNFALECILQKGNTYTAIDAVNIKEIAKRFSDKPIDKLEFFSSYKKYFYTYICGIKTYRPLNYIEYNRDRAFKELNAFCGFEYYGSKHLENIFTAFVQLYWLPKKFGVDKRSSHLSSMIVSGQITREQALNEINKPLYDDVQMKEYVDYIIRQIGITSHEFNNIMQSKPHQHTDYKTELLAPMIRKLLKL